MMMMVQTVVVGVTVVTVEVVVADADVGAGRPVAQRDAAHAATEAADVVEQSQTLDDHRGPASQFLQAQRTLFLAADAQHALVVVPVAVGVERRRLRGAQRRVPVVDGPLSRHLRPRPRSCRRRLHNVHVIAVVVVVVVAVVVVPLRHALRQRVDHLIQSIKSSV